MIKGPIALTYCASFNFYKVCSECDDLATCEVRRAMTYVCIQTLQALQGITVQRMVDGCDLPA